MLPDDRLPRSRPFNDLKRAITDLFTRPADAAQEIAEFARIYHRLVHTQNHRAADDTMADIAASYRDLYRKRRRALGGGR